MKTYNSGGPKLILQAFIKAKGKLDTKKLLEYFSKLNFIYPYHQAIGFYLDMAGYDFTEYEPFMEFENTIKFYLDYNIQNKAYSDRWNLTYPKEIEEFFKK